MGCVNQTIDGRFSEDTDLFIVRKRQATTASRYKFMPFSDIADPYISEPSKLAQRGDSVGRDIA